MSTTKGCDLDADCLLNTYLTSIAQVSAPRGHNILLLGWTWNYFYIVQALEMDFPFPCLYFPLKEAGYPPWFEPLCWLSLRSWAMLGPVHVDTWSISTCVGYGCFFFFFWPLASFYSLMGERLFVLQWCRHSHIFFFFYFISQWDMGYGIWSNWGIDKETRDHMRCGYFGKWMTKGEKKSKCTQTQLFPVFMTL